MWRSPMWISILSLHKAFVKISEYSKKQVSEKKRFALQFERCGENRSLNSKKYKRAGAGSGACVSCDSLTKGK